MHAMIVLDRVIKRFGQHLALDNVSLRFAAEQTYVLLGSSGCGKSTIIRLILGLMRADEGRVCVDNIVVTPSSRSQLRSKMGYVVQEGRLYPHLTAYRNVTLPAEVQKWSKDRIRARVRTLAEMVGLDDGMLNTIPCN